MMKFYNLYAAQDDKVQKWDASVPELLFDELDGSDVKFMTYSGEDITILTNDGNVFLCTETRHIQSLKNI